MAENITKAFCASNLLMETNLLRIQNEYEVDLGKGLIKNDNFRDIRLNFGIEIFRDSERMSRYYAIFYCIERQTRVLIADVLGEAHGLSWWSTKAPQQIRQDVQNRIQHDIDSGIALRSTEPIDYTTFGELGQIIDKNWDDFSDRFSNRKAMKRTFSNLNLLRGPIAHNSTFVESEADRFNIAIEDWLRQQKS